MVRLQVGQTHLPAHLSQISTQQLPSKALRSPPYSRAPRKGPAAPGLPAASSSDCYGGSVGTLQGSSVGRGRAGEPYWKRQHPPLLPQFLLRPVGTADSYLSLLTPSDIPEDEAVWHPGGGSGIRESWVQIPGPPLTFWVTEGKSLKSYASVSSTVTEVK